MPSRVWTAALARHYGAASQVLKDLGVTSVRLMTNNPEKSESLEDFGIHVEEQVLQSIFPDEYPGYRRRVPQLILGLGRFHRQRVRA